MIRINKLLQAVAGILLLVGTTTSKANADFIITVQSVTLVAGGAGSVNVSIESNADDNLDLFQYKFAISANPGSVGILRFTDPQSNSELSLGNYIHADSDGFISEAQNGPAFDTILGSDFTASRNGTDVTSQKILVRLDVQHVLPNGTPPSASSSDSYLISLVQDVETFFFTNTSSQVDILTATPGLVSITAVPEPSGLLMLCVVLPIACYRLRRI